MSYRQFDKYYEDYRNHNYNNDNRNLNRNLPIISNYYDPRRYNEPYNNHNRTIYPETRTPRLESKPAYVTHKHTYHSSRWGPPTTNSDSFHNLSSQRYNTNTSNEVRININTYKPNLPIHFTERNTKPSMNDLRKMTTNRQEFIENNNKTAEVAKKIENSVSTEFSNSNRPPLDNLNKRKNHLSMGEEPKPSTLTDTDEDGSNPPKKKPKIEQDSTNGNTQPNEELSMENQQIKDLKAYGKELAKLEQEMNALLVDYRRLKEESMRKFEAYRELKLKRKTLMVKMKNICKTIENDDDDSESEPPNGEAEQGESGSAVAANRAVSISSSDSCSSSDGPDVPQVAVGKNDRRAFQSSMSESDSDSDSSDVQAAVGKPPPPPLQLQHADSSSSDCDSDEEQSLQPTAVVISNLAKSNPAQSSHKDTNQASRLGAPVTSSGSLPAVKSESKINIKRSAQTDLPNSLLVMVKADEQNGLYNAVEPKLSTITISEVKKTFITDMKVFNNRLFVSASHGLLRQYHLGTHEWIMDYKGHQSLIHCLLPTVHPVGVKRILSGGCDMALFVHDIDSGTILHRIADSSAILSICDLLDFVYYGTAEGKVATFSLEKNREMSSFHASDKGISCLTATKEGNVHLLFVGANTGEYSVWNAITYIKLKIITPVSHVEVPYEFIVLQKQRLLAYTRNNVHFIQYTKIRSTSTFNHFDTISTLCLTRNYAIVGGVNGKLSIYKIKGSCIHKTPIRTITNSNSPVVSLTFYNNTIITGDKTGKIYFNRLVES